MRLFDLGIRWMAQYAPDTRTGGLIAVERLAQLEGYLSTVGAAMIEVTIEPAASPLADHEIIRSVEDQLARIEAEFSGRLLLSADDWRRFQEEPPDAMTWAIPRLCGLDGAWLAMDSVAPRVARWIQRGLVLTEGHQTELDQLRTGVRLDPTSNPPPPGFDGLIGLSVTSIESADRLTRAIEVLGAERVGISTNFLDGETVPGLENAGAILEWLKVNLSSEQAEAVAYGNALRHFEKKIGVGNHL
jgi:hypothetical protein